MKYTVDIEMVTAAIKTYVVEAPNEELARRFTYEKARIDNWDNCGSTQHHIIDMEELNGRTVD